MTLRQLVSRRYVIYGTGVLFAASAVTIVLVLGYISRSASTSHLRPRPIDPETSCGPISLAVVAEYLGKPISIAELHRETNAGELGLSSMADLLRVLKARGFAAIAVRYPRSATPNHRQPMILFVDDYHFVAALPGPAGDVVLVDPPTEPERVAWSALAKRWHGEAIVIGLHDEDVASALRR